MVIPRSPFADLLRFAIGGAAGRDLFHPGVQILDGEGVDLDQVLGDRVDPALVVGHGLVAVRWHVLQHPPQSVDGEVALGRGDAHQRVDSFLPQRMVVLAAGNLARIPAAHVVPTVVLL